MDTELKTPRWNRPAQLDPLPMPGRADIELLTQWIKGLQKQSVFLKRPSKDRGFKERHCCRKERRGALIRISRGVGKKWNLIGKTGSVGRVGRRSWARHNSRSQKKHILERRVIDHWNKIPMMITDFFVPWGLLINGNSPLENAFEPKTTCKGTIIAVSGYNPLACIREEVSSDLLASELVNHIILLLSEGPLPPSWRQHWGI